MKFEYQSEPPPALRIPPEILSEIFEHIPGKFPEMCGQTSPLVLAVVCNYWRSVALCNPRIWNSFRIPQREETTQRITSPQSLFELLRIWLRRSAEAPLSFEFTAFSSERWLRPLFDEILLHSGRWQHATLFIPWEWLSSLRGDMPRLLHANLSPTDGPGPGDSRVVQILPDAPALIHVIFGEHVVIASLDFPSWALLTHIEGLCLYDYELLHLFYLSENIVHCTARILPTGETPLSGSEPITMSHLRHLKLATHSHIEADWLGLVLIPYLSLPALEVLCISYGPLEMGRYEWDHVQDFIARSGCTLKELRLPSTDFLRSEVRTALPSLQNIIIFE
ncbi:hypothetical protein C8F01DRAFT_1059972 [Mycena amicta]|nr:hypothetical protein C8F01DRAFT_1059972 [Mycena amicta]